MWGRTEGTGDLNNLESCSFTFGKSIRSKWENLSGSETARHGGIIKLDWIPTKKLVVHLPEPNSSPNVCHCVLRNNSQASKPELRSQLMEQSNSFTFFLSALRELKSDVWGWGNDLSHPSGCSLQLEALVHVRYMVTGRRTFHPSSVTGRQLREQKKKSVLWNSVSWVDLCPCGHGDGNFLYKLCQSM